MGTQARHVVELVQYMREAGVLMVEPREDAVSEWCKLANASSNGKVWLNCDNWYLKTTKDDRKQGREASLNLWMETFQEYQAYFRDGKGGARNDLLIFS